MNPPWSVGQQAVTLTTLIPIGSLLFMPLRVSPALLDLLSAPAEGWTSLALSWWFPPLLSLPAIIALAGAIRTSSEAQRRRALLIALLAGWGALTGVLAGAVAVLVG